jgi:nucleoside-diphosphate-sugar epimerase
VKVFVTGSSGYVGRILVKQLIKQNFDVTGCDVGYFPENFGDPENKITTIQKDIRDLIEDDLFGYDAVLHLAALSNDPLGELNAQLTHQINFSSTVNLAKIARKNNISNFVFSSSCSTYGMNEDTVNEKSKLAPITEYAKTKVNAEKEILSLESENFHPTILRNATVYGISPNLRLDLVVNNLTASALTSGHVKLLSDGTSWRPLLHVEDMANAFVSVIKASVKDISGKIFNVGNNNDNYTVRQIAQYVQKIVPDSEVTFAEDASNDSRSYKVDFTKIHDELGYQTNWNLKDGIQDIYDQMKKFGFTKEDFEGNLFFRVRYLKYLLENKTLDSNLRY